MDIILVPGLWLDAASGTITTDVCIARLNADGGLQIGDASLQAATGFSVGGPATADRLSGVFGAGNLKLGLVLASLAPFPLIAAADRFGLRGWLLVAMALVVVVLLAGARASWVTLAPGLSTTVACTVSPIAASGMPMAMGGGGIRGRYASSWGTRNVAFPTK